MDKLKEIRYYKKGFFKVIYDNKEIIFNIDTFELTYGSTSTYLHWINTYLRKIKIQKLKDKNFDDAIYYDDLVYKEEIRDDINDEWFDLFSLSLGTTMIDKK